MYRLEPNMSLSCLGKVSIMSVAELPLLHVLNDVSVYTDRYTEDSHGASTDPVVKRGCNDSHRS